VTPAADGHEGSAGWIEPALASGGIDPSPLSASTTPNRSPSTPVSQRAATSDACTTTEALRSHTGRSTPTERRRRGGNTDAQRPRGGVPRPRGRREESGHHPGDDRYRRIVDPLDGTNNVEAGLPPFATAATLVVDDEPALAAAYVPLADDLHDCPRHRGSGTG
jgi:hypothetical protein